MNFFYLCTVMKSWRWLGECLHSFGCDLGIVKTSFPQYLQRNFSGGRVLITRGVAGLPIDKQLNVIEKVRNFNNFNKDNDPNDEHDFGAFGGDDVRFSR